MKLSIFTDEINRTDPERALRLASEWGIQYVEVRTLPGGRFPEVEDSEIREFKSRIDGLGLAVSGVSPGYSKLDVEDPEAEACMASGLPRACEWARILGTDTVSTFGFRRRDGEEMPPAVIDNFRRMAECAREFDCRLVFENESVCWGATGIEAEAIIREVASDNLSLCWDPGNSAKAGAARPYPDEYDQLKDLVSHVHMKNFDAEARQWSLMENGVVDWEGQLAALSADSYAGFIVVETHTSVSAEAFEFVDPDLAGLEANSLRNVEYVRSILDAVER